MKRALAGLALALGAAGAEAATVSLVIDDLGYSAERARRALALPPPVAVAILPRTPFAQRIARAAVRSDADVLVHVPMEAHGRAAEPGMLRSGMPASQFRAHVRRALAEIPGAIGINNHMGSRLTGAARPMALLMDELAHAPDTPVFIDSRTTAASRAAEAAREAGIASAERDFFLDHRRDPAAIERQVTRWLAHARTQDCALAIAHPYPETFAVLERMLPRAEGIERVGLHAYVERCGNAASPEATWHASLSRSRTAARRSRPSP